MARLLQELPPTGMQERQAPSGGLPPAGRLPLLLLPLALLWSLWYAGLIGQSQLNPGGWKLVVRFLEAALHPDLSPDFLALTLSATLTTLAFALCGTALSLFLGALAAPLLAESWWEAGMAGRGTPGGAAALCRRGIKSGLTALRSLHEVVWGLLLVAILGLDPLVAILAIGLPYGATSAKVFAEILDETPRTPLRALLAAGVSPARAFLYALLPAALPNLIAYSFYRLECAIRSAAVLGIIGAGGLGYQLLLSLQSLRYEQLWPLLGALVLLSGLTDLWSASVRQALNQGGGASHPAGGRQRWSRWLPGGSLLLMILLIPLAFRHLGADPGRLAEPRTLALLGRLLAQSFPPEMGGAHLHGLLAPTLQTLAMSILAITLAGAGAALFSFLAARNLLLPGWLVEPPGKRGGASWGALGLLLLARGFLLLCRAVPVPIWALLLLFVFFPGIWPGALALAFHNLGVLGRLTAELVEEQDPRPPRALRALGAPTPQLFLYAIAPRVLPGSLAYTFYRWEMVIRETAAVGIVGAGGLGRVLTEQLSSLDYRGLVTTVLLLAALTWLVDGLSALARRRLR